jgi:hypothetical protein
MSCLLVVQLMGMDRAGIDLREMPVRGIGGALSLSR